jgi:hypothetical protein
VHGIHRRPRVGERDRDVEQELTRGRLGDDGSLVADDEIVQLRLLEVRTGRSEHAPGDDDDMGAGGAGSREGVPRAWPQHAVLGDQRPVEVEREGGDGRRKRSGKLYGALPPVESTT